MVNKLAILRKNEAIFSEKELLDFCLPINATSSLFVALYAGTPSIHPFPRLPASSLTH